MCFIAWKPLNLSPIFEWIGVLFINLIFVVYGTQATRIHSLVHNRSEGVDINANNTTTVIDNNTIASDGLGDGMWAHCKSTSNTISENNISNTSSPK
eukprot:UN10388